MGYWNVNNIWKLAVGLLILTTIYYIIIGTTLSKDAFKTAAYVGLIIAIPTGILAIHQATEYIPIFISYLVFEYDQKATAKRESDRKKAVIAENERRRLANIQQDFEDFLYTNQQGISEQELKDITKEEHERETGIYANDDVPNGVSSEIPGWTRADADKINAENATRDKRNADDYDEFIRKQQEKQRADKAGYDALMKPVWDTQKQITYYRGQADDLYNSDEDRDAARTTIYELTNALQNYKNKKHIL